MGYSKRTQQLEKRVSDTSFALKHRMDRILYGSAQRDWHEVYNSATFLRDFGPAMLEEVANIGVALARDLRPSDEEDSDETTTT